MVVAQTKGGTPEDVGVEPLLSVLILDGRSSSIGRGRGRGRGGEANWGADRSDACRCERSATSTTLHGGDLRLGTQTPRCAEQGGVRPSPCPKLGIPRRASRTLPATGDGDHS